MRIKKSLALLLVLAVLASLVLSGCGEKNEADSDVIKVGFYGS